MTAQITRIVHRPQLAQDFRLWRYYDYYSD